MEYRKLPRGDENISILGLGTSSIGMAGEKEIESAMTMALAAGINFFDMASADAAPFPAYGRAISGMREKLYFQIHFGANYRSGKFETLKYPVPYRKRAEQQRPQDAGVNILFN